MCLGRPLWKIHYIIVGNAQFHWIEVHARSEESAGIVIVQFYLVLSEDQRLQPCVLSLQYKSVFLQSNVIRQCLKTFKDPNTESINVHVHYKSW